MHPKTFSGILLVTAFVGATLPAVAGILISPNQSDWLAAVGISTPTLLDFSAQNSSPTSLTVGPLNFAGGGFVFEGVPGNSSGFRELTPSAQYVIYKNSPFLLTASALDGVYAVAFYVGGAFANGSPSPAQQTITVTSTTGQQILGPTVYDLAIPKFYAIISDTPITSIKIDADMYSNLALGDVFVSQQAQSETPEAATLILIGTGLGVIARYRKYSRGSVVSA